MKNKIAITFDDGPSPEFTPPILDILKKFNVSATFFVVGKNAEKYPDIVKRAFAEGHTIGNHTYSHRMLFPLSRKNIIYEIEKAEQIILKITGKLPVFFRPPRGIKTSFAIQYLKKKNYKIALWTLSSCDWLIKDPCKIEKRILKYSQENGIILFHDAGGLILNRNGDRTGTVKALHNIICNLQNRNYKIVPLDEVMYRMTKNSCCIR